MPSRFAQIAIAISSLIAFASPVYASDDDGSGVELTGFVRSYAGVQTEGSNDYAIVQNTLEARLGFSGDSSDLYVAPYFYQYPGAEMEFGLRQAYIDIFFDDFDLRVGKQQIIWGKADGVFITDIVSPKDLSEFLLRDFEEIRQGITALKADYYIGDHTLELVLVPTFTATRLPEIGSQWRPTMDFPVQPTFDYSEEDVAAKLENGEVFVKFSGMTSSIDFELMAGYMWDDDPSIHITKMIDPATMQLSGLTVKPKHNRLTVGGGSFSTTLGGFVVRGEGAYYGGKLHNTEHPAATDGLTMKDYIHYLVGVDRTIGGVRMSAQFVQQVILEHREPLLAEQYTNTLTLLVSKDFLRETLRLDLFSYIGLNDSDALIRAKAVYAIRDGLEATLGADVFVGDSGMFGQYDDNDMVYAKLKYSF